MSGEKLELEFEITSWTDDVAEGTWHGHDTNGWLQSMAVESIEKWVVLLVEKAFDDEDAAHPWIKEGRLKLEVELYCEDGRALGGDTSSGLFVAYRAGIPR